MVSLRQIRQEIPVINRIHLRESLRKRGLRFGRSEQSLPEERLQQTIAYVQKNTVPAKDGRKCVDGRYPPDTARGMIARAGGDCGYVMALMAINKRKKLGLTPEQCLNAVYKVIRTRLHGTFCLHTDHHADPQDIVTNQKMHATLIGCGHLSKAATQRIRRPYDVKNEDIRKLIAYARNLAEIDAGVDMVNLGGEHAELGVLVVDDEHLTVNAWDPKLHEMFFIYDKKRDEAFMEQLVEDMAISGVTYEDMKKESDIQMQATLHNLARTLPLYLVSYTSKKPQVNFVSYIN